MLKRKRLRDLCREHTNLSESDIKILEQVELQLPLIADLTGNDIFINALTRKNDNSVSLVWGKPKGRSAYCVSPVGEIIYPANEPAVHQTLIFGQINRDIRGITPEGVPIAQNVVPISNSNKVVIGALVMERDISKELQQEKKVEYLQYTTEQLSNTLMLLSETESFFDEWLGNGIYLVNKQLSITYASKTAANIYQIHTGMDAIGGKLNTLINDISTIKDLKEKFMNSVELSIENRNYCFKSFPLLNNNKLSGFVVSVQDLTELRKKELELSAKSLVIQEIHHRVKNNLQNIAAVLRLQMSRTHSEEVKSEFSSCINRIMSMAFTHEALSQQATETIDIMKLCNQILYSLIDSSGFSTDQIATSVTGKSFELSSSQAIPLSLVINELITNSIKHGVSAEGGYIGLDINDDRELITITISDKGNAEDSKFTEELENGLGLQIVNALVKEKLDGFFRLERKAGITEARVCFVRRDDSVY